MPKIVNTRNHKARELFEKVLRGPASLHNTTGCTREDYNLWASTWVLPQLIDLIPQLRSDPPVYRQMSGSQTAAPDTTTDQETP